MQYYDLEYDAVDDDIDFFVNLAARSGSPILELGCGTGRLLQPLAEAGYTVTGVDLSPVALARAKARLAPWADRVTLLEADARYPELPLNHYRLAIWAINSFMHLETLEDQLASLLATHETLADDGLLALDLFQPDPVSLHESDGRLWHEATWPASAERGQVVKYSSRKLDLARQTLDVTFFYDECFADGQCRRLVRSFAMRYLHRYEARLLLEKAGFAVEALYGSYELDEFCAESQRMLFLARKVNR